MSFLFFIMVQGFFGSLREEFIMKKRDISITLCILGPIDTDNIKRAANEFKPGIVSKYPELPSPSDAALEVIKGGAQRWKEVYYTKMDKFVYIDLYFIMPEFVSAIVRFLWS